MLNLRYAEDTINDIKKIICYYADSIDYSEYIEELEDIIDKIIHIKNLGASEKEVAGLNALEEKANIYLEKARSLQLSFESQNIREG